MSISGIKDTFIRWDYQVTSPFATLSRRVYPRTMREVFAWSEELWMHHGLYAQAIQKAVRYFMTEIDISGDDIDYSTQIKYIDTLEENFDLVEEAASIGDDYMAYGNSFTSLFQPINRVLSCNSCGSHAPIGQMYKDSSITFSDKKFSGVCPFCNKKQNEFTRNDSSKPSSESKTKIIRWPPQYMEIKQHPVSKRTQYLLDITEFEYLRDGVLQNDPLYMEETPWEMIVAIVDGEKFEFEEGAIYHMAHPATACCIPALRGWGLPPFMAEFETALLVTMLDKYTEAIITDYLVPFRVLTPPSGNGTIEGDPMLQVNMGDFTGKVRSMLERHRRNPTDWNFLPFPLEYQVLGGEATQLAPIELQEHYEERLLASMGIPLEFYKNTSSGMSANAGPLLSLKMFERNWQYFINDLNKWLKWVINKQGELMKWEKVKAELVPLSLQEDPAIREIKLQLAAGQEISRATAYRPLGINLRQERKLLMAEEDEFAEEMEKRQKKQNDRMANAEALRQPGPGEQILNQQMMQQQQAGMMQGAPGGGAVVPGGAPPGTTPAGGGPMGATVDDILMEADSIAQQLLTADHLTRRQQLNDIKSSNEVLYAQVKSRLDQLEQQAATQGKQLARSGQMPPPQ
jgi:hypothetical protein